MQTFLQMPVWIGPAVLGAVLAATGYVAKLLLEWIGDHRRTVRDRQTRLVELFSLLGAGKVAFQVQAKTRDRLAAAIKRRIPSLAPVRGYERLFTATYLEMTADEKELHTIIRAYTEHTIRPLNESILQWLRADTYFMAQMGAPGLRGKLAGRLAHLEAHLLLWHAKYTIWIPEKPSHSLVYLDDEEEHGLGFPRGIEDDVLAVIGRGSAPESAKKPLVKQGDDTERINDSKILAQYQEDRTKSREAKVSD